MKYIFRILALMAFFQVAAVRLVMAQLSTVPDGGNKKAMVGERVGITDIAIHYDRPGVKKREGQIWGKLVPVGLADQGFGNTKLAPWRAGANENTTIEFSTAVSIEGKALAAGKYGFFIAYDPVECTLIFSKNNNSWGSFFYNPAENALEVKVKPIANDHAVEWLEYDFSNESENGVTVNLRWENLIFPFRVEVDLAGTQLASFRRELQTDKGFTWQSWAQAASWCAEHNTNLQQGLEWADSATSMNFGGDRSFQAWSAKAQVLDRMGRSAEAVTDIKKVAAYGNRFEVHQFGMRLLGEKKYQDAFDIFKANYDNNPNEFISTFGMARGYAGLGDSKKATEYVQKAQKMANTPTQKSMAEKAMGLIKEGKPINQ